MNCLYFGGDRSESDHAGHSHGHTHGTLDPALLTTEKGMWAVKWSFLGLLATAVFQLGIAWLSSSVALLADTLHNFGDAATAVPLWIAFAFARKKPTNQFSYGFGRVEDLAGIVIVLAIFTSGLAVGYESIQRLLNPHPVDLLWAVVVASVVGFIGNEAVARFRLKVGQEIGSAALIAEGHHARIDSLTSLGVLFGVLGAWFGLPWADPLVGLTITLVIFRVGVEVGTSVFARLLDGVDPEVIDEIRHATNHVEGVVNVTEVRVRWIGHRLLAEVNVAVRSDLTVERGHEISTQVRHQLLHHLPYLSNATIHIDPASASGEVHHRIPGHAHDGLPGHSH